MNTMDWKRRIGKVWPETRHINKRKIVLLYHSVGETSWGMPLKQFSEQIKWIHDNCRTLSLTQLLHSTSNDQLEIALSFDDGYVSLYDYVAPILAKYNMQAIVYINTGWIAEAETERKLSVADIGHYPNERFLTWPEVKALHQAGWEIGSHGVNHYNFASLQNETLNVELSASKAAIEDSLRDECLHFSYPWGRHSPEVRKKVKETGYQYAVGAWHAALKQNSNKYALPRINIANEYSFNDFRNIITGKWDYLGLIHRLKGL